MSMSSLGDTPVSHSAPQENDEEKTTLDTCGPTSEMPLASYDPATHSWKTSAVISLWGDSPSLPTLPPSGMTQNGALFQQPRWEPIIDATGLSLLHSPTAKINQMSPDLLTKGSGWWPTPTSRDHKDGTKPRIRDGKVQTDTLGRAVQFWPTPTYGKLAGGTGGMNQIEALYSEGTITAEERRAMRAGNGGKLNPRWVEWLMGFPLGWTDLEASETP